MKLRNILLGLLSFAAVNSFADALSAKPLRIGPVSYFGTLNTSGGKIIGAKNNEEAQVRGISLFWSDATGRSYYTKDAIQWAVENLKIDVFRFAMTVDQYKGDVSDPVSRAYAYISAPDANYSLIDKMVEAAIENDIYIIIDFHTHRAYTSTETAAAKTFFSYISKKYANVPNIIYEIYNEPIDDSWQTIKDYANTIVPLIRNNKASNLILVGTPFYSQMGSYGGVSGTNIAYVLHFYAGSHPSSGTLGSQAVKAKNSGTPVFISEWGTTNADGKGDPNESATNSWITLMENNKFSNCNWSFRHVGTDEASALLSGTTALNSRGKLETATMSTSGKIVKNYLTSHARNWNDYLTNGHRTGSCVFDHQNSDEEKTSINNVLKSGCTYTSSNENVVTVSGSNLEIKGPGYSILTGNDGSQTVVTIAALAKQTISKFIDLTCYYGGSCTSSVSDNYSGNATHFEWTLGSSITTIEGSSFTLNSLNPDIIDVKKATCISSSCYNGKGKLAYMYDFKNIGSAKIVATAPAVTGYKAMNDTVTVTFAKGIINLGSDFKDTTIALGSTLKNFILDKTKFNTTVTYTLNNKESSPFLTISGKNIIAGTQDAIVYLKAYSPETQYIQELDKTIRITIGDSLKAVNKEEADEIAAGIHNTVKPIYRGFSIATSSNGISLQVLNNQAVQVQLFDMKGQTIWNSKQGYGRGTHNIELNSLKAGHYILLVQQGSNHQAIRWNKK